MITDSYITSLKQRHKELERAIEEEANRPLPDGILVQMLKRQKLRIKDKLHKIDEA